MSKKSIAGLIDRGLFAPEMPTYLGVCRFVMFGWLFFWYMITDFSFLAQYPVQMWDPVPVLQAMGLSMQPSYSVVMALKICWMFSLLMACIGFFTRISIASSLLFGLYLLAATHSFNKINHSDAALLLAMFVLIFSLCGDGFSIDSLRRSIDLGGAAVMPSGEYRWPVQLVRIIWVIVFFLAGVAKLKRGGLDWMFSDSMANLVLRKQLIWEPPTSLGWYFLKYPWTCKLMAGGAVAVELLAPLVLFSKVARLLIVPAMLGMQIGIRLIMGDDFTQFMSIYVFFVPWLLLGAFSLRHLPLNKPVEVLYDGKCGLCGRTVAVLKRIDLLGKIRYRDITTEWREIQSDYPQITQEAALREMHVIDHTGDVAVGFAGYRRLAWIVPLGWLFIPILYFPGVGLLGCTAYRRIAENRLSTRQCSI